MQAFVLTTLFLFAPERPFLGSAFTVHQKRFSTIFVLTILMQQPPQPGAAELPVRGHGVAVDKHLFMQMSFVKGPVALFCLKSTYCLFALQALIEYSFH
jgi:hypothetical protein